jgi:FAD dependent oxidoreductase
MSSRHSLLLLALFVSGGIARGETIEADVVVYGGTAGGVSAACTAVKFGKTVALAEFGQHIGGLTSGGLGATDIGNKAAIGGFSREFYKRLGKHYNKAEAWTFAPSAAEKELRALLSEHKIVPKFNQRLASVKKQGARIVEISMEDGTVYRGKTFIDTTYEGDLMAKAGVSFMVGREPNSRFGETLNGIREKTPAHQFLVAVDPYVKPGDPSSGLLPFVKNEPLGTPGAGDKSIQAYNYRLCLTKKAENKLPIDPPPGYDAKRYELLGRYFEALAAAGKAIKLGNLLSIIMVTPDKTDINNNGGFSTDYIGANFDYPEADYATRAKIEKEHVHYIQGFLTFLKTDSRVPADVRADMNSWGLCKDEFQDTGGWPHAMYVREARRMLSDYVMTEKVCRWQEKPEDSVGLGAYNMDSHNCRRIVRDGKAHNEGDAQVGVKPYPVSYRSIVPKQSECENLFVPIALSATHIAYGSIRMEPVFMILGQSSATAAAMAIDAKIPVQQVPYAKLREQLLKDAQVLDWTGPGPEARTVRPALPGILLDDSDAERVGDWQDGTLANDARIGNGYIHDRNENKGAARLVWRLRPPKAGEYEVVFYYVPNENRAKDASLILKGIGSDKIILLNETEKSGSRSLGTMKLGPESAVTLELPTTGTSGYVVADGVQLLPIQ